MEDYKYLREIENISSSNTFVKYIVDRVLSNNYRGMQVDLRQCNVQRLLFKNDISSWRMGVCGG